MLLTPAANILMILDDLPPVRREPLNSGIKDQGENFEMLVQQPVQYGRDAAHIS
jgi:hypothetical protein